MGLNVREAPGMHPAQKALIYPYFTDGESETQRGEATCVWPHSMLTSIYWTATQLPSLVRCSFHARQSVFCSLLLS